MEKSFKYSHVSLRLERDLKTDNGTFPVIHK